MQVDMGVYFTSARQTPSRWTWRKVDVRLQSARCRCCRRSNAG